KNAAANGVNARIAAASHALDRAQQASSVLAQLASQARAELITTPGIDALSSIELATANGPNGALLTDTQMQRASMQLDQMTPAQRATFERMLAAARSPLEAAYLWQALGAGHTLAQVQAFSAAIHPHGDDQGWLTSHLTPNMNTNQYPEYTFAQGSYDDCVPASTIVAQAEVDPVLMLSLTTGGTAHGDDSEEAFDNRLQTMCLSQYVEGQSADGVLGPSPDSTAGVVYPVGGTALANQDLGAATGSTYHYQSLNSAADRAGVLNQVNQAVDAGKPVLIDVTDGSVGHQMVIIGRSGDHLEVYNPWGVTGWTTDSQFVNGHLGSLTDPSLGGDSPPGGLPDPNGIELPDGP
ncbi:MAG: hypothetical protein J2P25_23090, partial [Nocardiopsaceae bacterium]|nr:hypothetical protein [Nocardiopsaceae bacterium]